MLCHACHLAPTSWTTESPLIVPQSGSWCARGSSSSSHHTLVDVTMRRLQTRPSRVEHHGRPAHISPLLMAEGAFALGRRDRMQSTDAATMQ